MQVTYLRHRIINFIAKPAAITAVGFASFSTARKRENVFIILVKSNI